MPAFRWILRDPEGSDMRSTETFDSKDEAEAWMGAEWASLAAEGAQRVVLMQDEEVVYDMSLEPQ
jgi:hypothetical protein